MGRQRKDINWVGLWFLALLVLGLMGSTLAYHWWARKHVSSYSWKFIGVKQHTEGPYSVLVDEQGNVLDMMARKVYIGDEFISSDNRRYRVMKIEGNRAICREVGLEPPPFP